jgi:hypothetical protein
MSSTAWISTMLRLWIMRIGAHKAATPRGADSQTKPVEATGQDLLLARRSRPRGPRRMGRDCTRFSLG